MATPFETKPPDVAREDLGVGTWWTDRPGAVVRVLEPRRIEGSLTDYLMRPLFDAVMDRYGSPEKIRLIHDWSVATGYDLRSRTALTGWVMKQRVHIPESWVVLPSSEGGLLRLGVSTAALALRAVGVRLHLCESLDEAVASAGVAPAS